MVGTSETKLRANEVSSR
ncbi:hypothetical protein B4U80_01469 [Leptotrombidium deliense]|uniref:Uncharacterized protein n=1 Tax=Leptotrombidium deliense TaxID=299467 RepID=A0A443Q7T0_9ACAR|nr:hypothetical protein B4U80_01469 [Leptotrombidium deliense]